jgi:hypothetical protein
VRVHAALSALAVPLAACAASPPQGAAQTLVVAAPIAAASAPADPPRGEDPVFRVEIEQDGHAVPIRDHAVVVEARPFVLTLHLREPQEGIHVDATTTSRRFEMARDGKPFDVSVGETADDVFAPAHGYAEAAPNPAPDLYLDGAGSHYWYYTSATDHRCHEALPDGAGIVCRRRVERFGRGDPPPREDAVERFRGVTVFLVFMAVSKGTAEKDFADRVERQRDYLRVTIR